MSKYYEEAELENYMKKEMKKKEIEKLIQKLKEILSFLENI